MFHMLTCFNLKPEFSMDNFRKSVMDFTKHMQKVDLVHSAGPIGRRQSDKAVGYLLPHEEPGESIHKEVYSKVTDQIFICWEDI